MNNVFPNEQVEKVAQNLAQLCEEMNCLARESVDVAMKSATAVTRGLDESSRSAGSLMQDSVNRVMNVSKTLSSVKNPRELVDIQTEFMKDLFECWMVGTGKISEISARMTKEAMDPVAQYTNTAITKIVQKSSKVA
ncbi:MAG: phasin family protein [Bdellovibrionales bacterium]